MARPEVCLLDAYQTILFTDYAPYADELPRMADVSSDALYSAFARVAPLLTVGRATVVQAFAEALEICGVVPRPELTRALAAKSRELLLKTGELYDDTLEFLHSAREHGIKLAIVSNCDENTRALLDELGVTPLVDALVLSSEVRVAKPSAKIYTTALHQLGARPADALFVDDNSRFCLAAQELGLDARRIARGREVSPVPGLTTVRSLREIEPLLWD
jgi:HAD superfamily hydrolase (TIGR01509 family)